MTYMICIVDDNLEVLEIFANFFGRRGFCVDKASGGQECIDKIRNNPPDIILLDVMMEPIDGWMTLELIKNNPATTNIPVIMVSGKRPTMEELNRYKNLFVNYIMKPVRFPTLFEAVNCVLETRSK